MLTLPPLSLYIHIPWCVRKCPYCDFNSHASNGAEIPERAYVQALIADLDYHLPVIKNRPITSIFIGGGTPSLFSGESIRSLLQALHSRIDYAENIEITLESNPGTITRENLEGYLLAGVNRLSIGVQSFRAEQLLSLGRIHTTDDVVEGYQAARAVGFNNINLDLMFGLPSDNVEGSLYDLTRIIEMKPDHISWYQLTLEPNTAFYYQPPDLPDDDVIFTLYEQGQENLQANGYQQYEISAYCQNTKQCRHNVNYWEFGDYLGIGAGAHSKISTDNPLHIIRFTKRKFPREYMSHAGLATMLVDLHEPTTEQLIVEFMMNTLRIKHGFPLELFTQRTGLSTSKIQSMLGKASQKGLLTTEECITKPTQLGYQHLNYLISLFQAH